MTFDGIIFGNAIRNWSIAGATAIAVWILLYALKHFGGRRLSAMAERTSNHIDDAAAQLVKKTRWYFILAQAIRAGSVALSFPAGVERGIRQFAAVAMLLQLAVWGNAIIGFWITTWARRRGGTDATGASTLGAIGVLSRGVLWVVIAILALRNVFGYDITALLTGLGIGGIAIALAVQNVLGDLFAALSIVLDRPFEVGDAIAVDTFTGTVEHIGLKTTRIRATTGEQVIFSNTDLLKSRVRNLKRLRERLALLRLGVTYDTPPEVVADIPGVLRAAVEAQPETRFDRSHFVGFAESALNFEMAYYVRNPDYLTFMNTQQAVNLHILRVFNERGVNFAYPARTVLTLAAPNASDVLKKEEGTAE
jgi:small-conductance mechanosensitive channel